MPISKTNRCREFRPDEIEITHFKGSGPGGQNRNKRMTGVRVLHFSTGLIGFATERRSQAQNLAAALERLSAKIDAHFYRPKKRVPTRKTKGSQERRLSTKRNAASTKQGRKRFSGDD